MIIKLKEKEKKGPEHKTLVEVPAALKPGKWHTAECGTGRSKGDGNAKRKIQNRSFQ